MPRIQPNRQRAKIVRTAPESFRIYYFIKQAHSFKKPNGRVVEYDGHYLNRAYAVDGQFYECVTYDGPSIAVLETSYERWQSKGKIQDLVKEQNEVLNRGWKLVNRDLVGANTRSNHIKSLIRDMLGNVSKDPWNPTNEEFKLATEKETARVERLKDPLFKKHLDKLHSNTWSAGGNEEYQRALDFQRAEQEKYEQRRKKRERN